MPFLHTRPPLWPFVGLFLCGVLVSWYTEPKPKWTLVGDLVTGEGVTAYSHVVIMNDGRVILPGRIWQIFDPIRNVWARLDAPNDFPEAALCTLQDGRVLCAGGGETGSARTECEVLDPKTLQWSSTGALLEERINDDSYLLADGRVIVCGGYSAFSSEPLKTAEFYDPNSGKWAMAEGFPGTVATGCSFYDPVTKQFFVYSSDAGRWWSYGPGKKPWKEQPYSSDLELLCSVPDGRFLSRYSTTLKWGLFDGKTFSESRYCDALNNHDLSYLSLKDGRVIFAGGDDVWMNDTLFQYLNKVCGWLDNPTWLAQFLSTQSLRECDIFDPKTNALRPAPDFQLAHSSPILIQLNDGRILAAGGNVDDGLRQRPSNVCEVIWPQDL